MEQGLGAACLAYAQLCCAMQRAREVPGLADATKDGVLALAFWHGLGHALCDALSCWLHRCRGNLSAQSYANVQVCYAMQEADLAMLRSKRRDAGTLVRNSISLLACQARPEQVSVRLHIFRRSVRNLC